MNPFLESNVFEKFAGIQQVCEDILNGGRIEVPVVPGRDAAILPPSQHPDKLSLTFREGQARLLHDLASIELQAMELGLRTLTEYPEAPQGFREELAKVVISEAHHLELCLDAIKKLDFKWGQWPIHLILWETVSVEDPLLDRILIVHRYLEGSGLDAGDTLLKKLISSGAETVAHPVVRVIAHEEIEHVQFGSEWYREICRLEKRDPQKDFPERMQSLRKRLPRRIGKINRELRLKAGFTHEEIDLLQNLRSEQI